jgi:uncharacterized protein
LYRRFNLRQYRAVTDSTPTPATDASNPTAPPRVSDDVAYILPMAVFLLFTQLGVWWPKLYPFTYIVKTLVVAILLMVLWKHYTKIRWNHWWLGILVGIIGVVQWVGMENLLRHYWPDYPKLASADPYDPTTIASPMLQMSFIAVRWLGAALLVPVMEELFWRDYLWRQIAAPNDFKMVPVGEPDYKAFFIVAIVFSFVHIQWMTAIVWGLLIGWLLLRTRSLGACIIAHGVTNFLLGAWVLYTRDWYFW